MVQRRLESEDSRPGRETFSSTATSPASSKGTARERRNRATPPTPREPGSPRTAQSPPPTDASYSTILDATTAGEENRPARATVDALIRLTAFASLNRQQVYREHLIRIFVLDPIPAWIPVFNPLKRLTHSPSITWSNPPWPRAWSVSARPACSGAKEIEWPPRVAPGWALSSESLAAQPVRVYAEAASARIGHLRTKDTSREIDLIVEGPDRRVVAIEVKLSETIGDKDVRHLNWLRNQIGDRLADRPIITTGDYAYRQSDGVAVVPLALLGP